MRQPPVSAGQPDQAAPFGPAPFIYIKIPMAAGAADADLQRDDAIDQALREGGLGAVLGWGASLGDRRPDGSRPVAFHRIDVEVLDLAGARAALRHILPGLGAPAGTEIHYKLGGRDWQDLYAPSGWLLEQPLSPP